MKLTWTCRCRAEVDAECQQKAIHFVSLFERSCYICCVEMYIFEWFSLFGGAFWLENSTPEPDLRDDGPKSCMMYRKVMKSECPGLHLEALWGLVGIVGRPLTTLDTVFAGSVYLQFCLKSVWFLYFNAALKCNRYYSGQSSLASRFGFAVEAMETVWNGRAAAQN